LPATSNISPSTTTRRGLFKKDRTILILRWRICGQESDRVILESTVQNAIHAFGHPVSRVPIDSAGQLLIGWPFLIMERLEGSTLASGLEDQSLFQKLPDLMASLQVGIHQTDSTGLRTRLANAGVDIQGMTPESMLDRVSKLAEATGVAELTAIRQ
jgi:aminoglycoside phosphotransferase (APT) family kinase protein